ncbi:MAG TPA: hypothetical protein VN939_13400 [Chthoniobacterales bacterium]|nr:hypothetical protein [Chthoniobacterales bacterium]
MAPQPLVAPLPDKWNFDGMIVQWQFLSFPRNASRDERQDLGFAGKKWDN